MVSFPLFTPQNIKQKKGINLALEKQAKKSIQVIRF